ncbi:calpain-9-like [Mizuhopecten yessoensis]|uniref:Calpain-9 n=1 Tax=Mizuhopecten yessoensis TaxID=6573 RepID=A0A210QUC4_MIZYE|nr:calpain-9-like [Mizuhopecten yessoensis]OWF52292.1 Calpain-9 [Mizuhopecten yessoensis]
MGCTITVSSRKTKPQWPIPRITTSSKKEKEPYECVLEKRVTPRNWTNVAAPGSGGGGRRVRNGKNRGDSFFIDTDFPAENKSLFRHKPITKTVVWKRPNEISADAVLVSDGTSRHDMKQGELNDCWFLSTLSAIAEKPQLMDKIIPSDNTFGTPEYDGRFHCRFWQFDKWIDIYIDDRLPTVDGEILFAHSSDPSEFWVSLVEKAYAKLNKSYEALEYGFEADAFTDLTGGLAEWYNPTDLREQDFYLIRAAYQCGAVIGCLSVDKEGRTEREKKGMVSNHSYVITGVEEIPYLDSTAKLIRVRNPWGDTEWNGAWSDGSDEWDRVIEDIKQDLELTTQDDGEFWMNFRDFRREYCNMIICNLSPDFDHDGISDKAEYQISIRGGWKSHLNAGGWLECESFHSNPQYIINLHPDVNVQRRFNGRLPLVVSLLQVYRRQDKLEGIGLYAIGFEVFQLFTRPTGVLNKMFFDRTDPLMPDNEETYAEYRETSGRFFLDPGQYLLVPTSQLPNQDRGYLLRLFTVTKMQCSPLGNTIEGTEQWDL